MTSAPHDAQRRRPPALVLVLDGLRWRHQFAPHTAPRTPTPHIGGRT